MTLHIVNHPLLTTTLAQQVTAAIAAYNVADRALTVDTEPHHARLKSLASAAEWTPASDPAGVLLQAAALACHFEDIKGALDDGDWQALENAARCERLLVQIIRYLERTGGITRAELGFDYFSSPVLDGQPFGLATAVAA